jgi:cell division protein FtsZ
MSNAGSALMGIGRASGEDRAVVAAQQAIESPLLEVSIDGARGILFNVIGGNDLAMHEINTAAETITAAADPNANIIFGASINPDLEGEMIVTVVATGFDASYYSKVGDRKAKKAEREIAKISSDPHDDSEIGEIDMSLDDNDHSASFKDESPMPNIWSIDEEAESGENTNHEDDSDEPKEDESKSESEVEENHVVSSSLEEDLEKPSFLRRLGRKRRNNSDSDNENQ